MNETDILTIQEVADYLRITQKTAYRLAANDTLPGFKVGGSWRFKKSEIEAWIEKQITMNPKSKGRSS